MVLLRVERTGTPAVICHGFAACFDAQVCLQGPGHVESLSGLSNYPWKMEMCWP